MGRVRNFSSHVKWTDDEVAILRASYSTDTWADLETALPGRGRRVIQCKANAIGLIRTKRPKRTPDEIREAKRVGMALLRSRDVVAARAKQNKYRADNRETQTVKRREYYDRRFFWGRAMKLRGDERATVRDVSLLWYQQRGRCALTGRILDRSAQLDHITPRAKGGTDVATNLRWVCASINYAKRDMNDAELFSLCEDVVRWIGERIAAANGCPGAWFGEPDCGGRNRTKQHYCSITANVLRISAERAYNQQ